MSISNRKVLLEAGVAAVLVAAGCLLWSPADPLLTDLALHPGWLAVLVLAARYGGRGLLAGLGAVSLALFAAGALAGVSIAAAMGGRAGEIGDVLALGAALPIAWVGMQHEGRRREAAQRVAELEQRLEQESEAADALREAVLLLRARHDRVDRSLSFWRRIASRLQEGDAMQASRAALELCSVRVGARAGLVRLRKRGHWDNLAWRGSWTADAAAPADIFSDRTIDAAFEAGRTVLASEVRGVGAEDSDVAAPVIDPEAGRIVGVLALRGVPLSRFGEAERRDVDEAARWLVEPLVRAADDPAAGQPLTPTPSPTGGRKVVWG